MGSFLCKFQENSPPKVEIISPSRDFKVQRNSVIPYEISVADAEDGYSEYDEIQDKEVILTVQYLPDSSQVKDYLLNGPQQNFGILSWMGQSACFTCHSDKNQIIGPSFEQIAERYNGQPDAPQYLTEKIIQGTTGTWGNQIMPAQPHLETKKVREAVNWIIENSQKNDFSYFSGTKGSINPRDKILNDNGKSVYVLSAHYMDHGIEKNSNSVKIGWQHLVLNCE